MRLDPRIVSAIQADESSVYAVVDREGALHASNRARRLSASFARNGVAVRSERRTDGVARVGLSGVGCGGAIQPVPAVEPRAKGNRVAFSRMLAASPFEGVHESEIVEWYVNGPLGLEQGFDIASSPCASGSLVLSIDLGTDVRPVVRGADVELRGLDGTSAIRYGSLVVHDADAREIPARMKIEGQRLALVVDTTEARFPIVVDPLIAGNQMALAGDAENDNFGRAIDLDGSTLVVGVPNDDDAALNAGALYVFEKTSGWAMTAKILAPSSLGPTASFGSAVALSGDTLVASANVVSGSVRSAVYVFTRTGSTWSQQALLESVQPLVTDDHFGAAVDLEGDTLVVGAPTSNAFAINEGIAYAFTRTGTTWTPGAIGDLMLANEQNNARHGTSVAISGDTIAVGTPGDDLQNAFTDAGSVTFYQRSSSSSPFSFLQNVAASGPVNFGQFGISIALDGMRLLVGSPGDVNAIGSGYVLEFQGTSWVQKAQLFGPGAGGGTQVGQLVALSGGTAMLVGRDSSNNGRNVYVFTGSGTTWTSSGAPVSLADSDTYDANTRGIALDGATLALGAMDDDANGNDAGKLVIYDQAGTSWNESFTAFPSLGTKNDKLGQSVAISGALIAVGASQEPDDEHPSGRAFVYERNPDNTWVRIASLGNGESATDGEGLGSSVATDGDLVVVGAPHANGEQGRAYVFANTGEGGWQEIQSFYPDFVTPVQTPGFGASVAIWHHTIAIGEPRSNLTGEVGMFLESEGFPSIADFTIAPPDSTTDPMGFGSAVAHANDPESPNGGTLVVGAPTAALGGAPGMQAGAAYVFFYNGDSWVLQTKLLDGALAAQDELGASVALEGDTIMVGAPGASAGDGYVAVFTRTGTTWMQRQHLAPSSCTGFGSGVGLSGDRAVIAGLDCYEIWSRDSMGAWQFQSSTPLPGTFSAAVDGDTFVVGSPDAPGMGAAFVAQFKGANGDPCSTGSACASSLCVDTVCCDAVCTGTCMTCNGSAPGTCSPQISADDPDTCTGLLSCSATGVCHDALGVTCSDSTTCASGFCVDGVCCDTACGGDAIDDCQACATSTGATKSGTCELLTPAHECRASTASCDPAESCTGVDATCPNDANCSGPGGAAGASGLPDIWGVGDLPVGGASQTGGAAGASSSTGGTTHEDRPDATKISPTTQSDDTGCSIGPTSTGAARDHGHAPRLPLSGLAGVALVLSIVSRRRDLSISRR